MRVAVIGGGSWGTALAALLAGSGRHAVSLWCRDPELASGISSTHENPRYLGGIRLPQDLVATADLAVALDGAELVVAVPPSHVMREVMERAAPAVSPEAILVTASKGVELGTFNTMTTVLSEVLPRHAERIGVLSGPGFAREVASQLPTAVTAAAADQHLATKVQEAFTTPLFRVYSSTDVVGVELGGAVKNVIAVAAGVSDGLGLGHSTRAALITRGLAEITRLAVHLGADARTLSGLSGLGDLVVTCTGDLSRNRSVGIRLGRGERLDEIVGSMNMVAEGVRNTRSVWDLARSVGIDMPITEQMFLMLYEGKSPRQVVGDLMTRQLRPEVDKAPGA
jgi:glycerol-3-phosphate dehydrogenase (NAD(P)+)